MNQKGSLTTWNDAKGFGFITPEGGGERVFAHISNYAGRGRPVSNRKVTYSLGKDEQGRPRAGRFRYVGAARVGASIAPGFWLAAALVLALFGILGGLFHQKYLPITIVGAYGAVSLVTWIRSFPTKT